MCVIIGVHSLCEQCFGQTRVVFKVSFDPYTSRRRIPEGNTVSGDLFRVVLRHWSHRSYATSSPVSTGIGDNLWRVYHPDIFHSGPRPTQPGHPSVDRCNEYWRWFWPPLGKKQWVLRSSRPCFQECWHTGLLHASLIGSNSRRLKGNKLNCNVRHSICVYLLLAIPEFYYIFEADKIWLLLLIVKQMRFDRFN